MSEQPSTHDLRWKASRDRHQRNEKHRSTVRFYRILGLFWIAIGLVNIGATEWSMAFVFLSGGGAFCAAACEMRTANTIGFMDGLASGGRRDAR